LQNGKNDRILLSVVVPLFNEEDNLQALFARFKEIETQLPNVEFEFIFVDDGSGDNTFSIASSLCKQHPNITVLKFERNYGSHPAIAAGFAASRGDCVIFIAGDLQDPPALIGEMIDRWRNGSKIVWAARTVVQNQPFKDMMFSILYWGFFNVSVRHPVPARGVDFFLVDKSVVDSIRPNAQKEEPIFAQITETGLPSSVVHYAKQARAAGKSGWTLKKKLDLVFQTLIYSPLPAAKAGMMAVAAYILALLFWPLSQKYLTGVTGDAIFAIGGTLLLLGALLNLIAAVTLFVCHLQLKDRSGKAPRFVIQQKVVSEPSMGIVRE
jgi:polyisoprenyl-phosphate glycosyltransferase